MSWIRQIAYEDADDRLRKLYDRVKGPDNSVDNIMLAHGLRPHSMEGHMVLYKNVLHHKGNTLPKHLLETIGVYVSILNKCDYCERHHFAGLRRLLKDEEQAEQIHQSLQSDQLEELDPPLRAALAYAKMLTLRPQESSEEHIERLRSAAYDDGQILEINQVVAYFNYANRTVLGLGVNTAGDILGLSPGDNDDPSNWAHS